MNDVLTIFFAGIAGVFMGMAMLYGAIYIIIQISIRIAAKKDLE